MPPTDRWRSTSPPWVHLCVLKGQPPDVALESSRSVAVKRVEGERCTTKAGLLSEFARALAFPPYFGQNWDAFEECLTDLSWMPAAGYLIGVTNAERVLPGNEEDYATFIDTLRAAAQEWAARAIPFHVVMMVAEQHRAARKDWRVPRLTC